MTNLNNDLNIDLVNALNLFCYSYDEDSNTLYPANNYSGIFQTKEILKIVDELKKRGISYEVNYDESISILANN